MHKKKLLTLVTLICVTVGVEAVMLIKRGTLMNRNCRKVLLRRGGHRVTRVVQVIRRISGRLLIDHRVRFFLF
jgi:hypothetical protein